VEYIHNIQGQIHVLCVLTLIWITMDSIILNWKQNKSVIRDVSSHLFNFLVLNLSHELLGDIPNVGPNSPIVTSYALYYVWECLHSLTLQTTEWVDLAKSLFYLLLLHLRFPNTLSTHQTSKPQLHLTIIHISQFLYQAPSYWHKLIQ
jgi:hypothetical protein